MENLQFKEVEFICKCGERKKEVILIEGDYGFQSSQCENCGRRNFVEYENDLLSVKSVKGSKISEATK